MNLTNDLNKNKIMSKNCPIMERMKNKYEKRSRTYLTRGIPVIMRLDGKAFHTYTRNLVKPFDKGLIEDMQQTAIWLCQHIQGAKAAYTQSDEISILLTDYDKLTTEAWFDYNVQKMTSVSASYAAGRFNNLRFLRDLREQWIEKDLIENGDITSIKEFFEMLEYSYDGNEPLANFDSRVFTIPREDVSNYFVARQRDAVKNSISMLAQSLYSHKELHGVNGNEMQELCWQKGHNWNDLHFSKKRGSLIVKNTRINGKIEYDDNGEDPKIGDIWYQPENQSTFYPDKRGRLLEWGESESDDWFDWRDVPIKSIRTQWEVVETPEFSKSDIINKLTKYDDR